MVQHGEGNCSTIVAVQDCEATEPVGRNHENESESESESERARAIEREREKKRERERERKREREGGREREIFTIVAAQDGEADPAAGRALQQLGRRLPWSQSINQSNSLIRP
jgi:hypothetical protein